VPPSQIEEILPPDTTGLPLSELWFSTIHPWFNDTMGEVKK